MLVMSRTVAGLFFGMRVVVPQDVCSVVIPCMVRVPNRSSILLALVLDDLKVLGYIENDVFMAKNIPGDVTSVWGYVNGESI